MFGARILLALSWCSCAVSGLAGPRRDATYYLSPDGDDSNPGTTPDRPWRSFEKVLNPSRPLRAGDVVVLLDGTYTRQTTGLPHVDCRTDGNAPSGAPGRPIVVRAQNERRAFLQSDGYASGFTMEGCSWWLVEGLRVASRDADAPQTGGYPVVSPGSTTSRCGGCSAPTTTGGRTRTCSPSRTARTCSRGVRGLLLPPSRVQHLALAVRDHPAVLRELDALRGTWLLQHDRQPGVWRRGILALRHVRQHRREQHQRERGERLPDPRHREPPRPVRERGTTTIGSWAACPWTTPCPCSCPPGWSTARTATPRATRSATSSPRT